MNYQVLLTELEENRDEKYRAFHSKLLKNDSINVIGVRVPALRKTAKKFKGREEELLSFPDDYYEVTFIKLIAVSSLPYDMFVGYVEKCLSLINNWATCDCFKADCIGRHRDDFLPYIYKFLNEDKEFYQRYAVTTLLNFYVDKSYLNTVWNCVNQANTEYYYTHMSVAWLVAEVLCKYFDEGVEFLKANSLDIKTHNKAILKARESFRISPENKKFLLTLKR